MEIKEQIEKLLEDKDAHFTANWVVTDKILKIFEQANPIQAGKDGLAKNPYLEDLEDKLYPKTCELVGKAFEQGCKSQKALDDKALDNYCEEECKKVINEIKQAKAEAVKKIFDWVIRNSELRILPIYDSYTDPQNTLFEMISHDKYEAFKKQTLEELEEKK